jgi:hypothetical protein
MTAKAALALALLEGRVLNVKNCFNEIGLTNIAREIPRLIEKPFGVQVSRTPKAGKSRFNQDVTWTDYRLNSSPFNADGITKMKEYVKSQLPAYAKTDKEAVILKQQSLFLNL